MKGSVPKMYILPCCSGTPRHLASRESGYRTSNLSVARQPLLPPATHALTVDHLCPCVSLSSPPPPAMSNSRGEYLLNGEFVVSMFKREIEVGSVVIEYSGSDHVVERINCTERIEEEVIVQVVSTLRVLSLSLSLAS